MAKFASDDPNGPVELRINLPKPVYRRLRVIAAENDTDLAGAIGLLVCLSNPTTGSAANPTPHRPTDG